MQISKIQAFNYTNAQKINSQYSQRSNNTAVPVSKPEFAKLPAGFHYSADIHFGEFFDPNRTIPHIDYEEYMAMKPHRKQFFRKKYTNFFARVNKDELFDSKDLTTPLQSEKSMDEFIKIAKVYSKYKDNPIICLGRSPKWFLNAAIWMKDGIPDYDFVAFSKYWFRPDPKEGMRKISSMAPTEKEEAAYRKYLKRIKADPQTIVDRMKTEGKKTIITDYICTGKGACSFLDVLSHYAEDLGILEDFSKSIKFLGIGSIDYMEYLDPYSEYISIPKVIMPPRLMPYSANIEQEFHNMDFGMFKEMLLNQNVNECRSTYFPHETWTVYKPDRFKTGLIKDVKKVKKMIKELKGNQKSMSSFTPAMFDLRNLLNFHILDELNKRNLLKLTHKSKL